MLEPCSDLIELVPISYAPFPLYAHGQLTNCSAIELFRPRPLHTSCPHLFRTNPARARIPKLKGESSQTIFFGGVGDVACVARNGQGFSLQICQVFVRVTTAVEMGLGMGSDSSGNEVMAPRWTRAQVLGIALWYIEARPGTRSLVPQLRSTKAKCKILMPLLEFGC